IHRRLGDVKRRFVQAEHLRQAAAVIRVFVGDQNSVEAAGGFFNGGEAGAGFALCEGRGHPAAGGGSLQPGYRVRAARSKNGYAQADRLPPETRSNRNSTKVRRARQAVLAIPEIKIYFGADASKSEGFSPIFPSPSSCIFLNLSLAARNSFRSPSAFWNFWLYSFSKSVDAKTTLFSFT